MSNLFLRTAPVVLLAAGAASAQTLDLSLNQVHVTQTIQTGTTTLVAGKSTMVRVPVFTNQALAPGETVDGVLRIFDNGVELPGSPIYSTNGPLALPLTPSPLNLDDTLNFIFIAPSSSNITLDVEVNPAGPGQLAETSFANNTHVEGPLSFVCKDTPEVIYIPIDYRPSGGPTPNLPDPALIEPGVGDNFIQGIYPGSDWEYRPADVPSKLWTSSLSGSGSALLSSLNVDYQMLNPKPDFIYGWVNGSLPYNGQAIGIPGTVGIGNTQPIRHQRTFAHELGHLFGRSHNSQNIDTIGVDIEHHLAITESLPVIKNKSKKDIMAAGLLTNQAWVWSTNYNFFLNHAAFQCAAAKVGPAIEDRLVIGGVFNHATGTVELNDVVAFDGTTPTFPEGGTDLILAAFADGRQVGKVGVTANGNVDCSETGALDPTSGFAAVVGTSVPASAIERITVTDARTGQVIGTLLQSSTAPAAALSSVQVDGSELRAEWSGSDADGDAVRYYLRYSPDGQRTFPVATGTDATELTLDLTRVQRPGAGAWIELLASDGLNTTRDRQPIAAPKFLMGAVPTTYILTPDNNTTFQKGATVVLHSSGWDLEDRGLTGASITWSSDLDGAIGTGRVTSVSDLSVGTHVLTVSAVDSGSQLATDTTTVTITDRVLPGGGTTPTCQPDIGLAGPGSAVLAICGGDLSTGTSVTATLTGAAPSQVLWVGVSNSSNPTAMFGGTLVSFPAQFVFPGATDAGGSWSMGPIAGGGGPSTLFVQAVYVDPAQTAGFGISNAVQMNYLP
ncbi:MAG: hypothetical protein P1V81_11305 [Planctomycetota bacterium]|nr:hypothetical protein [Planctomycetota bacterium]